MKKEEVDEHVDALIAGQDDLSEEFKSKAATIFESAVNSKVKEIAESMEVEVKETYEQDIAKAKEELTEKVDSYLSYIVEEWLKEVLKVKSLKTLSQVLKNFSLSITLMFQMKDTMCLKTKQLKLNL
jgi:hypothetical protein